MMPRSSRSSAVSLYKQNTQALIAQPVQPSCSTMVRARLGVGKITWQELDTPVITHIHLRLIVNSLMLTTPHLFLPLQAQANPENRQ